MTAEVFADSFYYLALLSADDKAHSLAVEVSKTMRSKIVTTEWVVMEVADALCHPQTRGLVPLLLDHLRSDLNVIIVEANRDLFDRRIGL